MKKATIIIAVLEATVLLVMKLMDWKESKTCKPAAGQVRRAAGHRVVNPAAPEYDEISPEGDGNATNFLTSSSPADEEIHEKERRPI